MTDQHPLSDDDIGEPVVDTEGTQVGTIADVDGSTAFVDPEVELDDVPARGSLGWDDPTETQPIDAAALERDVSSDGTTFRLDLGEHGSGESASDAADRGPR